MSIVRFEDVNEANPGLHGGKGASLAKMVRAGFVVPPGFIIDANSYRKLDDKLKGEILAAFDELGTKYVAVRSSAIAEDGMSAAWAGQLETYLNTTRDELTGRVEDCWNSLSSERAKAYADENNVDLVSQKVAVVVQAMAQSDVSGVAFSAHPITQSREQVVIEAAYGLGEAVVSGQVTPDTYIVNKSSGEAEKHLAKQTRKLSMVEGETDWWAVEDGDAQKLSDEHIKELTEAVVNLEKFYKFAVDVEWLVKDGTIYITQSRPITTLNEV